MVRQTLQPENIHRVVEACCRPSPNGLVPNGHKGHGPSQDQSVARSVAQDVVSPPIAVRRIERSDGERVTSHDRSHRTERVEHDTVRGDTVIGRMGQHTRPKGFKRSRDDGGQATKTFAKGKGLIHEALAQEEGVVKGAIKSSARLTSRQRYAQRPGRDPLSCPHCQGEMGVWRLWPPTYGVIYAEGEGIKRGPSASTAPRAGP
jgi:hypothetical protein